MSREDPDVIDSVEKAFRLLQTFSAEHATMTVSEAAAAGGLERLGFAETDGRSFRLTAGVLRLGYGYLAALPFWEHAQPHMRWLHWTVARLCMWHGCRLLGR